MVLPDGLEALDFLFRRGRHAQRPLGQPSFVLLDIKMPRIDGLEVLAQLKSDPQLKLVPVVMWSSSLEQRDVARGYALGCNAYVAKQLDFERFATALRTLGAFWTVTNQPPPETAQAGVTS